MTKRRTRNRTFILGSLVLVFLGIFSLWISNLSLPTLEGVFSRRIEQSTKIYDRAGEILLYDVSKNSRRTTVSLDDISLYIQKGAIAIEDKNFYTHKGLRFSSLLRAFFVNTTSLGFSQGGSTITQQVVKNVLLSNDKTVTRKLKEVVLSLKLERVLSKNEILALYFNEIPYGGNIYGVEEATETFFGKKAARVSLAEAAYLSAMPQAPSFYSPYGKNMDKLEERKNLVLDEMKKNGFISEDEYQKAKKEIVAFQPKQTTSIKAPHFIFYVIDYLKREYGDDVLETGGLRVITTLDWSLEAKGEEIAKQYALENQKNFNASNAAFVAIDPKTGQILSMVGSRDYFDQSIDGNFNVTTSHRQPGSTFKPFVYAEAFLKGFTPDTIIFDVKTQFAAACRPDDITSDNDCYSPDNYDNKFRGPITLRNSLAQSINISSVKTLYLAGLEDSLSLARNMGVESLQDASRYGLTLVLGGGEVSPLELTSAYGTLASGGIRNVPTPILQITDSEGNVLESFRSRGQRVISENITSLISNILSDNEARAPAFGQTGALHFSQRAVAVKTGTTNDYRDAWTIGYTPSIVLGAWAGNNDNSPMEKKVAGFIVAPMWRAFMDYILAKSSDEPFPSVSGKYPLSMKPVLRGKWQGGTSVLVDKISGGKATEFTPEDAVDERLGGGVHSILYWTDKDNPQGPPPGNPDRDPQFKNWEYGVRLWAKENGFPDLTPQVPTAEDTVHTEAKLLYLDLLNPRGDVSVKRGDVIGISLKATSGFPINRMSIFINDSEVFGGAYLPNPIVVIPKDFSSDAARIRIEVIDQGLQKAEVSLTVPVS
ncbi:MAG TPA: transglycosylase domain-containing protein [Candidatus Paceibacterota bacterium]